MDGPAATAPVAAPWVWIPAELAARSGWEFRLDEAARAELGSAVAVVRARGLATTAVTAADFPLPTLEPTLARVLEELADGSGVAVIRGLPVERYDRDGLALLMWGLGTHLGVAVPQSYRGDMIGDVMDMSHTGDIRRNYRSPRPLELHVDPVDVVGLLCLRPAQRGGESLVASGIAVHNAILAERPDLMPALWRGFHYRNSEADSTGEPPTTRAPVPVFARVGGRLVCNFNASPISRSFREDVLDHDPTSREAFALFREVARRDSLVCRMDFRPGDLQLLNNRVVLHGRTEFVDWPEVARKRHLLRLWLRMPGWPAWPDALKWHDAERHADANSQHRERPA